MKMQFKKAERNGLSLKRPMAMALAASTVVTMLANGGTVGTGTGPEPAPVGSQTTTSETQLDVYRETMLDGREVFAFAEGRTVVATAVGPKGAVARYDHIVEEAGETFLIEVSADDPDPESTRLYSEAAAAQAQLDLEAKIEGQPYEIADVLRENFTVVDNRLAEQAGASNGATPLFSGSASINDTTAYAYGAYRRYGAGTAGGKAYFVDESKVSGNAREYDTMKELWTDHRYSGETAEVVNWQPDATIPGNDCNTGTIKLTYGGVSYSETYTRCDDELVPWVEAKRFASYWKGSTANGTRTAAAENLVARSTTGDTGWSYQVWLKTCYWNCKYYNGKE